MHMNAAMAHGDIKPDNLVLDNMFRVLLIDLGHAERIEARVRHCTGTRGYRPVEVGSGAWY